MNNPSFTLVPVRRVREADGARCLECDSVFDSCHDVFWHWRKSQYMHERGTGHRTQLFRIVWPAAKAPLAAR